MNEMVCMLACENNTENQLMHQLDYKILQSEKCFRFLKLNLYFLVMYFFIISCCFIHGQDNLCEPHVTFSKQEPLWNTDSRVAGHSVRSVQLSPPLPRAVKVGVLKSTAEQFSKTNATVRGCASSDKIMKIKKLHTNKKVSTNNNWYYYYYYYY